MPTTDQSAQNAALINTAGQLANTAANAIAQGNINKKTRQWNEQQYAKQRNDALADWTRQNDYNHPSAQMARLRDAGLNPNLVYGNGADTQSGPVRGSDTPAWNPRAANYEFNAGSVLGSYYDTRIKEATTDNLRAQNTVMVQDALMKAAQTAGIFLSNARTEFDLQQANRLKDITVEKAISDLNKVQTETTIALRQDERAQLTNAVGVAQGVENILNLRASRAGTEAQTSLSKQTLQNLRKDGVLKDLDIELRKQGIQPNDSLIMRVLGRALQDTNAPEILRDFLLDLKKRFGTGEQGPDNRTDEQRKKDYYMEGY